MKKLAFALVSVAVVALTGCLTERTHVISEGERTEDTSGLSEKDIRVIVSQAVQDIDNASVRYAKPGARRIINIKPFVIDTTARASQRGYLMDTLKMLFEEELMNHGNFVVYNEEYVGRTGNAAVRPEFILTGRLREQNVRRDNGNVYKELSLLLKLTDVNTGLDFWQKRVPFQKGVDKRNVLR